MAEVGSFYSVAYEVKLASNLYPGGSYWNQFKAANTVLDAAMKSDLGFASTMWDLGIAVPRSTTGAIRGVSPPNWVWHHGLDEGILQLVPKSQHPNIPGGPFWETMHPNGLGGNARWNKINR
jgi:hypothetical protein